MSGGDPAGRRPDFLILGEAKCGSTTLWKLLSRHPRVYFPEEKELHFFASYSDFPGFGRLETRGMDAYTQLFAGARIDQICGEATPNYLFDAGACARIRSVLPEARLVAILRDPVERAWSQYWHQVRRGRERLPFEKALEAEEQRLAQGDPDQQSRFSYVARGRYIEGLRRFEGVFSRAGLCVVLLEELRREPQRVLEGLFAHLGLAGPDAPTEWTLPHANKTDFPRWPRLDALTRSLRRWADQAGPGVSVPVRAIGRLTRPLRTYSGAPRVPEATRRALRRTFAESDRQLAEWLGRSLPWAEGEGSGDAQLRR